MPKARRKQPSAYFPLEPVGTPPHRSFPPKLSQLYIELRNCVKGIDSFGDRANARAYAVRQTLGQTANFRQSAPEIHVDRKSTRLNSSHRCISYAVFCLKKNQIPHSEGPM